MRPGISGHCGEEPGWRLSSQLGAGGIAGEHGRGSRRGLAMAMDDRGGGPVLERPAGGEQAPAEVDVAARADPLGEAPGGLERRAADEQVGGRAGAAGLAVEALGLAQVVACAGVARQQTALLVVAADLAGEQGAPFVGRLARSSASRSSGAGTQSASMNSSHGALATRAPAFRA